MEEIKRITLVIISLLWFYSTQAFGFDLIKGDKGSTLYYNGDESVVKIAIDMLIDDSKQVCHTPFSVTDTPGNHTIIIGIPDREPGLKELTVKYGLDTSGLTGKWEAYQIQSVQSDGLCYLFVLGSDPRGTAYGVLELSRQIGVTPWIWWADVVPEKKTDVVYTPDNKVHAPSVEYRGIFLNDEDWALMPWATRTFEPTSRRGAIGPETYSKIFELLLRLRANTLCPAMHECTLPFYMVEGNKEAAERYGIIISTSHAEPMMRTNTGEWDSNERGPFNYFTNKDRILSYWDTRVQELTESENIYTTGLRGIHDGRMQGVSSLDEETKTLENVIVEQRDILKKYHPEKELKEIPQIFVPYKEVLEAYNNGLELPDDITIVWCDDTPGYIMRLGDIKEQKRSGGAGVYYHISYWGKPHDYLWLASTQPALIYSEMKRAWDNGARRYWVLNVGDIKPGEYLTEFFLDMAWDIDSFSGNSIYAHQEAWLGKVFGTDQAGKINEAMKQYYHLAGQRKPEHMGWNLVEDWELRRREPHNRGGLQPVKNSELSVTAFGDEMQRRIDQYDEIEQASSEIYQSIPGHLRPAFFQLVHYPVAASAAMNRKMLYAQKSRLYANEEPSLAAWYADKALQAYNAIAALDYTYNKDMMDGKWELMMDMKPRDLPVFQEPVLPALTSGMADRNFLPVPPEVSTFVETAGTPVEGDRMIALNACNFVNAFDTEVIEGLGHSGNAVRLPKAKKIDLKQPHLAYKVKTVSNGAVKVKVGTIPMHSLHGDTRMRYAVVIDNQKPLIVETYEGFLSDKWAENVLRNQSLTVTETHIPEAGDHMIRIYSLDEELLIDQLMLEFDLDRKHYLIPVR